MKAIILALFVGAGLSGVYLLPKVGQVAQSAVNMKLADHLGSWSLQSQPPTEAEINTLSSDTEFSKALCLREKPGELNVYGNPATDQAQLSVVLSGADINNSIHRPERCMPAQGHENIVPSDRILTLPNGRKVSIKRLASTQTVRDPRVRDREESLKLNCLTYYFFVGHDRVTNDHMQRTIWDMEDRLIRGVDQRWAYISASMWYGKMPGEDGDGDTLAATDAKLVEFITNFSENQINWKQITR